jgi:hypothetical protein
VDVGNSINPALDMGQVCVTNWPCFLFVKAKTTVGSAGKCFIQLTDYLLLLPFSQNLSTRASCKTQMSHCLMGSRRAGVLGSF